MSNMYLDVIACSEMDKLSLFQFFVFFFLFFFFVFFFVF